MKTIITGASRGIGRGIATVLGRAGLPVGVLARTQADLETLSTEIEQAGGRCEIACCDLRAWPETEAAIEGLIDRLGGVDALINNAGVVHRKDIFSTSVKEWNDLVATNLHSVFYATRAVLPFLRDQGRGHVINVSSISGRLPLAPGSAYAATKYAVTGFSESLFLEVREYGIKVTTVFPGSVDSESHRQQGEDPAWKITPQEVGQACLDVLQTSERNCISRLEIRPLRKPQ